MIEGAATRNAINVQYAYRLPNAKLGLYKTHPVISGCGVT